MPEAWPTERLRSIGFAALLCLVSLPAHAGNYVFATFTGDALANEQLSIYRSADALDFTLVANTGFAGPSGALRDPSIVRHTDGRYYVAYTDPIGAGCCGKEDHFSVARSDDLVHWTNLTTVPGGVPGLAHVWAPEWFVDGGTVMIVANIDTLNTDSDFKPYLFTAQDQTLTTWSGPTPLGLGPNYIDTFVLKTNGIYHAFLKNETTRYVEHATAAKVTGPWTFVGTGNWAAWGSGMEGPCVTALDDGTWRIFLDGQGAVGFLYADSRDLMTWSKTAPLPLLTDVVRHGTVFRDESLAGAAGAGGSAGAGGAGHAAGAGGVGLKPAGSAGAGGKSSKPPGDAGIDGGASRPPNTIPDGGTAATGGSDAGEGSANAMAVGGANGRTGGASGGAGGTAAPATDGASGDSQPGSGHGRQGCSCAAGGKPSGDFRAALFAAVALFLLRRRARVASAGRRRADRPPAMDKSSSTGTGSALPRRPLGTTARHAQTMLASLLDGHQLVVDRDRQRPGQGSPAV